MMDDLISRQAVIDAVCEMSCGSKWCGISCIEVQTIEHVPSAQPDVPDTNVGDTISRQAAIDALNEYFARIGKLKRRGLTKGEKAISLDTVGAIKTLPSAQPEIIRCKDCKHSEHWYRDRRRCFLWSEDGISVFDDGFCNYAERRYDG